MELPCISGNSRYNYTWGSDPPKRTLPDPAKTLEPPLCRDCCVGWEQGIPSPRWRGVAARRILWHRLLTSWIKVNYSCLHFHSLAFPPMFLPYFYGSVCAAACGPEGLLSSQPDILIGSRTSRIEHQEVISIQTGQELTWGLCMTGFSQLLVRNKCW